MEPPPRNSFRGVLIRRYSKRSHLAVLVPHPKEEGAELLVKMTLPATLIKEIKIWDYVINIALYNRVLKSKGPNP